MDDVRLAIMRFEFVMDAIIGLCLISFEGVYKEGNINGLVCGKFRIGFKW